MAADMNIIDTDGKLAYNYANILYKDNKIEEALKYFKKAADRGNENALKKYNLVLDEKSSKIIQKGTEEVVTKQEKEKLKNKNKPVTERIEELKREAKGTKQEHTMNEAVQRKTKSKIFKRIIIDFGDKTQGKGGVGQGNGYPG